jgi:hypothetical protein
VGSTIIVSLVVGQDGLVAAMDKRSWQTRWLEVKLCLDKSKLGFVKGWLGAVAGHLIL